MPGRLANQLGLWAAAITALLGAIYLALLVSYFATQGFTFPPTPFVQLAGGLITFATNTPLTAGAFITWGPVLLALAVLFTVWFYRGESLSKPDSS